MDGDRPVWLEPGYDGPTPSLAKFLAAYAADDTVLWMMRGVGDVANLLDEALAERDRYAAAWRSARRRARTQAAALARFETLTTEMLRELEDGRE